MSHFFIKLIATVFGIGYLPFAPGSICSLAGVFIIILIKENLIFYLLLSTTIITVGFFVSGKAEEYSGFKDPQKVVIDEMAGVFVAFFLLPYNKWIYITTFLFYRLIDVLKPPPLRVIQKMPGSLGIMGDDLLAGLYTNLLIRLIHLLF